jgi:hypothetical protein
MVQFNINDYKLKQIRSETKLSNLITKYQYCVYGLKRNKENPPIYITIYSTLINKKIASAQNFLRLFFKTNEIITLFEKRDSENNNSGVSISVGLRKDLREHTALTSAIVQTIVYAFENRLKLFKNSCNKIPGIPKFEYAE